MLRTRKEGKVKEPIPEKVKVKTLPPPMGGINSRDPLSRMPEHDAINLKNWIPTPGGATCRKGYRKWATLASGKQVRTLMHYFRPTDNIPSGQAFSTDITTVPGRFFAATDTEIRDVSDKGVDPVFKIALSGVTNAGYMSHTIFSNSAGTFLIACSELDGVHRYDGTSWYKYLPGDMSPAAANPQTFVFVLSWKKRLWFVQKDSCALWYLQTDAISGNATKLDVGPLFKKGGKIEYIANWTIDAGEGIDDLLVIVGTNGDVIIYKGSNPDSAATFGLQGQWSVGQIPKGRRAFCQLGGDLLILSSLGLFPVSYITRGGSGSLATEKDNYTDKIHTMISNDGAQSFNEFGWELHVVDREDILLMTVPDHGSTKVKQYAMSIGTNAWGTFEGLPAKTAWVASSYLFTADAVGSIYLSLVGDKDNVGLSNTGGIYIRGIVQWAYTPMDSPETFKSFKLARPLFTAEREPGVNIAMSVDFQEIIVQYPSMPTLATDQSLWGVAVWDRNVWVGGTVQMAEWMDAAEYGRFGSVVMATEALGGSTFCTSVAIMAEVGGVL